MDLITAAMVILLVLIVFFSGRREAFTMEERLDILEKRVDDLYSGGATARHYPVFSSANQRN
jgi:hypothetical protein